MWCVLHNSICPTLASRRSLLRVLRAIPIVDVLILHPLDSRLRLGPEDEPLHHPQHMRQTSRVRMQSHGEDELIVMLVEVIKSLLPDILHGSRIHPTILPEVSAYNDAKREHNCHLPSWECWRDTASASYPPYTNYKGSQPGS